MGEVLSILMMYYTVYDSDFANASAIHGISVASQLCLKNKVCFVGQNEDNSSSNLNLQLYSVQPPVPSGRNLYGREANAPLAIMHRVFLLLRLFIAGFIACRVQRCHVIYARHGLPSIAAVLVSKLNHAPLILEANGLYDVEAAINQWPSSVRRLTRIMELLTLRQAQAIVAVTNSLKDQISHSFGIRDDMITVISNGVDIGLHSPKNTSEMRRLKNLDPDRQVVCFVGNFVSWQGLPTLVDCAPIVLKSYPDTLFLLVGDGPLRSTLQSQVMCLHMADSFRFAGKVPHSEVPEYINTADVCVAPFGGARNRLIGLSPLKLYEYMACGKPVVASNIPGVGDLLTRNGCGLAVEPDDAIALAQNLIRLLSDDRLALEMGKRARKTAVEFFGWNTISERIEHVCYMTALRHLNKQF